MKQPIRQPGELNDEYSFDAGISFEGTEDLARQEFKEEADINFLLAKFGVNTPNRPPTYAEVDYDIDLQSALMAIHEVKKAHRQLPEDILNRYPSWQSLLNAVESGTLQLDLQGNIAREDPSTESANETPDPQADQ
jgi:hypothetical protein